MVQPVLQALLLADNVYSDVAQGKNVIAGTFLDLKVPDFPTVVNRETCVYVRLTGVRGMLSLRVRYVDLLNEKTLLDGGTFETYEKDPLAYVEIVARMPALPLPHEGVFAVEVLTGEHFLGSVRLNVNSVSSEFEERDDT